MPMSACPRFPLGNGFGPCMFACRRRKRTVQQGKQNCRFIFIFQVLSDLVRINTFSRQMSNTFTFCGTGRHQRIQLTTSQSTTAPAHEHFVSLQPSNERLSFNLEQKKEKMCSGCFLLHDLDNVCHLKKVNRQPLVGAFVACLGVIKVRACSSS